MSLLQGTADLQPLQRSCSVVQLEAPRIRIQVADKDGEADLGENEGQIEIMTPPSGVDECKAGLKGNRVL